MAGTAVALAIALFVILLKGGTEHVAGQVFDSKREPMADTPVTIQMVSDGAGSRPPLRDEDGRRRRFHVAAKVDPENSSATQPTRYIATANIPYGGGSWKVTLKGVPENEGNEDDLKFYANVDGGAFVLDDYVAAEHLDFGDDSVIGRFGDEGLATLHFEPLGKLVDGTRRKAFSAQVPTDNFLTILGAGGVVVPLGPWRVTGEVEGNGLTGHLFFEGAEGEAVDATEIDFPPDTGEVRRNVLLDPADVPPAEEEPTGATIRKSTIPGRRHERGHAHRALLAGVPGRRAPAGRRRPAAPDRRPRAPGRAGPRGPRGARERREVDARQRPPVAARGAGRAWARPRASSRGCATATSTARGSTWPAGARGGCGSASGGRSRRRSTVSTPPTSSGSTSRCTTPPSSR